LAVIEQIILEVVKPIKMNLKFYLICLHLIFGATTNAQTTFEKIITVNPYLSFQNYEHFKRLTLSSTDSHVEYLENFNFEWGYLYKLNVTETKLSEELSDGTQFEYTFNHIVSKTKMADSSEFKLFIDPNRYYYELDSNEQHMNYTLKALNDSTYLYFDEVEIEVPNILKDKFNKIVSREKSGVGYFKYVSRNRIRLIRL
jgi:hypothetical protein